MPKEKKKKPASLLERIGIKSKDNSRGDGNGADPELELEALASPNMPATSTPMLARPGQATGKTSKDLEALVREAGQRRQMTALTQLKALNHAIAPPPGKLGEVAILNERQIYIDSLMMMEIHAMRKRGVNGRKTGDLGEKWLESHLMLTRATEGTLLLYLFRQGAIEGEQELIKNELRSRGLG